MGAGMRARGGGEVVTKKKNSLSVHHHHDLSAFQFSLPPLNNITLAIISSSTTTPFLKFHIPVKKKKEGEKERK